MEDLVALNKSLQRESRNQSQDIGSSVESLISNSLAVEGYELITNIFEGIDAKELREIADRLRNSKSQYHNSSDLITDDKAPTIVACSKDVDIDAREIMKHLINQLGGSGGGRPDFAQGGVDNTMI